MTIIGLACAWLAFNVAFVLWVIYRARKHQKFLDWHARECAESRKRLGIST